MEVLAIIQARVGSTRLPGKVLTEIEGQSVLEHVIRRVRASKKVDEVIVATTSEKADRVIVDLCQKIGTNTFCGSEEDVLDRYYQAALVYKPAHIVRITADCPLIDPGIIDLIIDRHLTKRADYTSNTIKETYPDGEDVEVFTFSALKKAWENAVLASDREHVTVFLRKHPELFKLESVESPTDLRAKRWTLDNQEDLEYVKRIYEALYKKDHLFSMEKVLEYLVKNPKLEKINSHIVRNEGYQISLLKDKMVKTRA